MLSSRDLNWCLDKEQASLPACAISVAIATMVIPAISILIAPIPIVGCAALFAGGLLLVITTRVSIAECVINAKRLHEAT